ncbi:GntR family transcriptional regulator, partial [Streptomyces sp. NPDC060085]|uniref:GntR family transcriptional regulator n=1 Tax=Streptomyces sp. NPDC060085 TaxID=3347054 RepID=UPI00364DA326
MSSGVDVKARHLGNRWVGLTLRVVHWFSGSSTQPLPEGGIVEALPRETIVDVLEDRLRTDILDGRHPAGSYLPPERRLADGYGVTRTTLKHAFG